MCPLLCEVRYRVYCVILIVVSERCSEEVRRRGREQGRPEVKNVNYNLSSRT